MQEATAESRVREYLAFMEDGPWIDPVHIRIRTGWSVAATRRPDGTLTLAVGESLAIRGDGEVLRGLIAQELARAQGDNPGLQLAQAMNARGSRLLFATFVGYLLLSLLATGPVWDALVDAAAVTLLVFWALGMLRAAQTTRRSVYDADQTAAAWVSPHAVVAGLEWLATRTGQPKRIRRKRRSPLIAVPTLAERLAALNAYVSETA